MIRVFRVIDWFLACLEPKLWFRNQKFVTIQLPQKVTIGIFEPMVIKRQQIDLESCSNPLKMEKVV